MALEGAQKTSEGAKRASAAGERASELTGMARGTGRPWRITSHLWPKYVSFFFFFSPIQILEMIGKVRGPRGTCLIWHTVNLAWAPQHNFFKGW